MKKITALFLAVILAVAVAVPVLADDVATLTIESKEINAGESAVVNLNLTNNPGVAAITMTLQPDAALNITQVKKGGLFSGWQYGKNIVVDEEGNTTDDGLVAKITVAVPAETAPGTYEIGIIVREIINEDYDDLDYEVVKGVITVPGDPEPEIELAMSATPKDSAVVAANFYVKVGSKFNPADYSIVVNDVATDLTALTYDANGYKLSVPTDAKRMGESISLRVLKGGEVKAEASTSIKAYAEALVAGEFASNVKAVASAMLVYGAAAQTYFGYETDALVTGAKATDPVVGAKFDNVGIIRALVSAPVKYTAMSVSCLSDITLSLAFQVRGDDVAEALAWVEENITIDGKAVDATAKLGNNGSMNFIIVDVKGITLDKVLDTMDITVAGADAGSVGVINYLYAIDEAYNANPAKAGIVGLVRALYAYASSIEALA